MDLHLFKQSMKKEKFSPYSSMSDTYDATDYLTLFISVIISVFAGYLSWGCSGNYPGFLRVIFAILAAFFGTTYIVLYYIFRADKC
jgi:hypothetical protein